MQSTSAGVSDASFGMENSAGSGGHGHFSLVLAFQHDAQKVISVVQAELDCECPEVLQLSVRGVLPLRLLRDGVQDGFEVGRHGHGVLFRSESSRVFARLERDFAPGNSSPRACKRNGDATANQADRKEVDPRRTWNEILNSCAYEADHNTGPADQGCDVIAGNRQLGFHNLFQVSLHRPQRAGWRYLRNHAQVPSRCSTCASGRRTP